MAAFSTVFVDTKFSKDIAALSQLPLNVDITLAYYVRHHVGIFEEFFILFMILPVWFTVKSFVKQVTNNVNAYDWESVKHSYISIRRMTDLVNDIIWPNLFVRLVQMFVYYSFNLDAILATNEQVKRIRVIIYFVAACCFFYLGADVSYKVISYEIILKLFLIFIWYLRCFFQNADERFS